jgi:hypothetical protein
VVPRLARMVPSLGGLASFQFAFVVRDLDQFVGEFDGLLSAGHGVGGCSVRRGRAVSTGALRRSGRSAW